MEQENIPTAMPVSAQPQPAAQPASSRATTVLILGILSLVCAGIFTGIPAIILGSMEQKAIKAGLSPKSGEGITKVGYILGIVSTVFSCLIFILIAIAIMLPAFIGSFGALKQAAPTM